MGLWQDRHSWFWNLTKVAPTPAVRLVTGTGTGTLGFEIWHRHRRFWKWPKWHRDWRFSKLMQVALAPAVGFVTGTGTGSGGFENWWKWHLLRLLDFVTGTGTGFKILRKWQWHRLWKIMKVTPAPAPATVEISTKVAQAFQGMIKLYNHFSVWENLGSTVSGSEAIVHKDT